VGQRVAVARSRRQPRGSGVSGWLRRRQNGLIAVVAVLASGALVLSATNAAFTATTTNPGNTYAAGTVTLTDNDAGSAMFTPSNLKPGDSYSSCITVSYTGSLPSLVKLYGTTGGTGLAGYLDLTITRGTISSGGFGDCTNFTPDAPNYLGQGAGVIYSNTLANVPTSVGTGVDDPHSASVPEAWTANEAHAYKFTATLQDTNAAQGLTATEDLTWQAVNTTSYSQVILADGPASYWKLDEAAGTTAADATGAHDGGYTGGPILNQPTGVKDAGSAVTFDGVDDYVYVGDDYRFGGRAPFAVESWINPTAATSSVRRILDKTDGYSGWYMALGTSGSATPNQLLLSRVDGVGGAYWGDTVYSSGGLQPGTWHHVVGAYDGSTLRLYVDGSLEGQVSSTRSLPTSGWPLAIGADVWGGENFGGRVDEVAIYDYPLSQQQVTEHFDAGRR
jgi:hypothetical protein